LKSNERVIQMGEVTNVRNQECLCLNLELYFDDAARTCCESELVSPTNQPLRLEVLNFCFELFPKACHTFTTQLGFDASARACSFAREAETPLYNYLDKTSTRAGHVAPISADAQVSKRFLFLLPASYSDPMTMDAQNRLGMQQRPNGLRRNLTHLSALLILVLVACTDPELPPKPEPPQPEPVVFGSRALGTITLEWLTSNRAASTDSSSTLRLTPLSYSDLDDLGSQTRYLTVTFSAQNLSAGALEHLTLRAIAPSGGIAGTALTDLRGFPTAQEPDGLTITDGSVAARVLPIHGTVLLSQPSSDPASSDFQAYTSAESLKLEGEARTANTLTAGDRVLDYGFVVRDAAGTGRRLAAGATGRISVAVRLPRSFTPLPKPYRFKLSFLATTDNLPRVTRGLGESTDAAVTRAIAFGSAEKPAQLVLFGSDADAPSDPKLKLLRITAPRIGLDPSVLLEVTP
jgi:hypothetical protein